MVGGELHTRLRENAPAFFEQDALGLSRIYVQTKRYSHGHSVGRPEVQAFVGALHGAQANQGVFLTTSTFTPGAQKYADSVQLRVVLIDGALLTGLMIRHGVGTQIQRTINWAVSNFVDG